MSHEAKYYKLVLLTWLKLIKLCFSTQTTIEFICMLSTYCIVMKFSKSQLYFNLVTDSFIDLPSHWHQTNLCSGQVWIWLPSLLLRTAIVHRGTVWPKIQSSEVELTPVVSVCVSTLTTSFTRMLACPVAPETPVVSVCVSNPKTLHMFVWVLWSTFTMDWPDN